jgi:hypothetical protein
MLMLTNYKTLVVGALLAGLNLYANGASLKQCLVSSALFALGALAKDFNVTGGSVDQGTPSNIVAKPNILPPTK